jgi:hypothetical protein
VFSSVISATDSLVTVRGFQWWPVGSSSGSAVTVQEVGSWGTGIYGMLAQGLPVNTNIYVRAFARNGAGFSDNSITNTVNFTTLSGIPNVTNVGSSVNSTIVTLTGSISNLNGGAVAEAGFSYGIVTGVYTNSAYIPFTTIGTYQVTLGTTQQLSPSTTYYYLAFAQGSGGLGWATNEMQFTTGATVNISTDAPTVVTYDPTVITTNSFKANGGITDIGGGYITHRGFQWSINGASWAQDGINAGNQSQLISAYTGWSVGNFSVNFTASTGVSKMYYRAFVLQISPTSSLYVPVYGDVKVAIFSTVPGQPGTSATPPSGPGTNFKNDFTNQLKQTMNNWGMDNPAGHWAFMGILMMIAGVIGIGLMIYCAVAKMGQLAVKGVMVITLAVELAILGTFIFSGLLGIWPVIILIVGVIGWLFMIFGNVFNGGRQAANG